MSSTGRSGRRRIAEVMWKTRLDTKNPLLGAIPEGVFSKETTMTIVSEERGHVNEEVVLSKDGCGQVVTAEGGLCDHDITQEQDTALYGCYGCSCGLEHLFCSCEVHDDDLCFCGACEIARSMQEANVRLVEESQQAIQRDDDERSDAFEAEVNWTISEDWRLKEEAGHWKYCGCLDCQNGRRLLGLPSLIEPIKLDVYDSWGYPEEMARRLLLPDCDNISEEEMDAYRVQIRETLQRRELEAPFAQYVIPIVPRADPGEKLPAMVERVDGATILYSHRSNLIFGPSGVGKTQFALCALDDLMRNHKGTGLYLDFEDSAQQLADSAVSLGNLDIFQDTIRFKYLKVSIGDDPLALEAARKWVSAQENCMVVIDSMTAAGCPHSNADREVVNWFARNVHPWVEAGAGMILIDHQPKTKVDRPDGPIGSERKVSELTGVALQISGIPWNKASNGKIVVKLEKDRAGDIVVQKPKVLTVLNGKWAETQHGGRVLTHSWDVPDADGGVMGEGEDLATQLLNALAEKGLEGVRGSVAIRGLVKGPYKKVNAAIKSLLAQGLIERWLDGKVYWYHVTPDASDMDDLETPIDE